MAIIPGARDRISNFLLIAEFCCTPVSLPPRHFQCCQIGVQVADWAIFSCHLLLIFLLCPGSNFKLPTDRWILLHSGVPPSLPSPLPPSSSLSVLPDWGTSSGLGYLFMPSATNFLIMLSPSPKKARALKHHSFGIHTSSILAPDFCEAFISLRNWLLNRCSFFITSSGVIPVRFSLLAIATVLKLCASLSL